MPGIRRLHDTKQITGLNELSRKLSQLHAKTGVKTLRKAVRLVMKPAIEKMRLKVPRGDEWHTTYKGRPVGPGFLSRSIVTRSRFNRTAGKASIIGGVRSEAYYGVSILDTGPHTVTRRHAKGGRSRSIKPYVIKKRPWFKSTFIADVPRMTNDFSQVLRTEIRKATV